MESAKANKQNDILNSFSLKFPPVPLPFRLTCGFMFIMISFVLPNYKQREFHRVVREEVVHVSLLVPIRFNRSSSKQEHQEYIESLGEFRLSQLSEKSQGSRGKVGDCIGLWPNGTLLHSN